MNGDQRKQHETGSEMGEIDRGRKERGGEKENEREKRRRREIKIDREREEGERQRERQRETVRY